MGNPMIYKLDLLSKKREYCEAPNSLVPIGLDGETGAKHITFLYREGPVL